MPSRPQSSRCWRWNPDDGPSFLLGSHSRRDLLAYWIAPDGKVYVSKYLGNGRVALWEAGGSESGRRLEVRTRQDESAEKLARRGFVRVDRDTISQTRPLTREQTTAIQELGEWPLEEGDSAIADDTLDEMDRGRAAGWWKNPQLYHGTGAAYERPDPSRFQSSGLFGPGYYLTDSPYVASSYAGEGLVDPYEVERRVRDLEYYVDQLKRNAAGHHGWSATNLHSVEDALVNAREQLRLVRSGGPNVRVVQVPDNLRLLDADKVVSQSVLNEVNDEIGPLDGLHAGITGDELWHLVYDNYPSGGGDRPGKVNLRLSRAGFDGIRYRGGKRVPLKDAQGHPVEHDVTVIFEKSLHKVKHGFKPGTSANPRWRR